MWLKALTWSLALSFQNSNTHRKCSETKAAPKQQKLQGSKIVLDRSKGNLQLELQI